MKAPLVYHIVRHAELPGVRLSKGGHWQNIPFGTDADAVRAATGDARGCPFTIERKEIRRKLHEVLP